MLRRVDSRRVKKHHSYTVGEVAELLGVCRNTVRNWQRRGLEAIDGTRPTLLAGSDLRAFLDRERHKNRQSCSPGTLYCFGCRAPRRPMPDLVEYQPKNAERGLIYAFCSECEAVMCQHARRDNLARVLPGIEVQIR